MSDLHQFIANLLSAMKRTDTSLESLKIDRDEIDAKYEPTKLARCRFNSWRDSNEGRIFKKLLYDRQKCRCANQGCQINSSSLPIEYFEIDHKLPIVLYPDLALVKNNMHLLCTPCNRKKSSKI